MATETLEKPEAAENGATPKRVRRQPKQFLFEEGQLDQAKEVLESIPDTEGGANFNLYKCSKDGKTSLAIATSPADALAKTGNRVFGIQVENLTGQRGFSMTPERATEYLKTLPDAQRQEILKALQGTVKPVQNQPQGKKR